MPCFHPLPGWYGKIRGPSGKRPVVFQFNEGLKDRPVSVPCGRCTGCLLERARQWAVRCQHETASHTSNLFVTLTYDDDHLPPGGSLRPRDMVLFLKRLRKAHGTVRYFQCGEYGDRSLRPHHHALLFGCSFGDARRLHADSDLSRSDELDQLWSHGLCTFGEVTFESANYVARYSLKKLGSGALPGLLPPYLTMSRRPGIGSAFIARHAKQVAIKDYLIVNGNKSGVPRFYRDRLSISHPEHSKANAFKRRGRAASDKNCTGSRLIVRETVKQSSIQLLKRELT